MDDADRKQIELALAALTLAFVGVLQDLVPSGEPLPLLQRKMQVQQTRLRETPGAETAITMFRFVIDKLRDPQIIEQPED